MGFVVARDVVREAAIADLGEEFRALCGTLIGAAAPAPLSGAMARLLASRPDIEARAYDRIRDRPGLAAFASQPTLIDAVRSVLGSEVCLLRKIVFRIDLPRALGEYAHWHQDHFYVRGDSRTVTAWIPLQDTGYESGCLSVMPMSHQLGPLEHTLVIGKRHVPPAALDRHSSLVPMRAGDALLFHSCLVHASNINWTDGIRYSVQARYIPRTGTSDPGMGGVIDVD